MEIRAVVENRAGRHGARVSTNGRRSEVVIDARDTGQGSSTNGGELLCLALATCYCNDLYREAMLRALPLDGVEVEVIAEFGGSGEPARRIRYWAHVESAAPAEAIEALLRETDQVAEVHNTLRRGIAVELQRPSSAEP